MLHFSFVSMCWMLQIGPALPSYPFASLCHTEGSKWARNRSGVPSHLVFTHPLRPSPFLQCACVLQSYTFLFLFLCSTLASCNVYTFLSGDSPYRAPRSNVAVVPNTLVHQVLVTCEPLFINDAKAAPGRGQSSLNLRHFVEIALSCLIYSPTHCRHHRLR